MAEPQNAEQALQQLLEQEGRRLYADGAAITENGRQRHGAATFDAAVQDVTAKLGNAGVDQLVNLMVKKPPTSPLTSSLSPATIGPSALASRSSCRVRGSPGRKRWLKGEGHGRRAGRVHGREQPTAIPEASRQWGSGRHPTGSLGRLCEATAQTPEERRGRQLRRPYAAL
jgi:hypothetical protein